MGGIFERDRWAEIFDTMRKHKLRTFLTALGVFWGIFMLVFVVGMGTGLRNGVFRDFGSSAKNVMYVWAQRTSMPYKGLQAGRRVRLTVDDIRAIQDDVPGVHTVEPRLSDEGLISLGDISERYEIRGELGGMVDIEKFKLPQGRYISTGDVLNTRKVCVIGERVKEVLFGEREAIGEYVQIKGIPFTVVGIMRPDQVKPWTESDLTCVVIPLTTMHAAFDASGSIDYFVVQAEPDVSVASIEPAVRDILRSRHSIHPEDSEGIGGFNLEEEYQQVRGLFTGILGFLWFVGIGTLLAGIGGVSNIMLIVVKERTKEIGVRKALGATPRDIISQILTESVFITSVSGYLGLLAGTFIIGGAALAMQLSGTEIDNFYNPQVIPAVGIGSVLLLIIAGLVAGFIPAMSAARVNPVVALKDE